MHSLIITQGKADIKKYLARLKAKGHTYELVNDDTFHWGNGEPDWTKLRVFADALYASRAETIDQVRFFLSDWKLPATTVGKIYYSRLPYVLSLVKIRTKDDETADHEDYHFYDYIVRVYLGFELKTLFGVEDFNHDVVHANDPRFKEYEYELVWKVIEPYVTKAIQRRKQMALMSAGAQVAVLYRKLLALKTADLMEADKKIKCPLQTGTFRITQRFGEPSARYPLTKHHVGVDLAAPLGTPIYAPCNLTITRAGFDAIMGNYCYFTFTLNGEKYSGRFMHMQFPIRPDSYRTDDFTGRVGSTGDSDGPHLHVDFMRGDFTLTGVTPKNFRDRFVDPLAIMEGF